MVDGVVCVSRLDLQHPSPEINIHVCLSSGLVEIPRIGLRSADGCLQGFKLLICSLLSYPHLLALRKNRRDKIHRENVKAKCV